MAKRNHVASDRAFASSLTYRLPMIQYNGMPQTSRGTTDSTRMIPVGERECLIVRSKRRRQSAFPRPTLRCAPSSLDFSFFWMVRYPACLGVFDPLGIFSL